MQTMLRNFKRAMIHKYRVENLRLIAENQGVDFPSDGDDAEPNEMSAYYAELRDLREDDPHAYIAHLAELHRTKRRRKAENRAVR